jgi:hypothetical protein
MSTSPTNNVLPEDESQVEEPQERSEEVSEKRSSSQELTEDSTLLSPVEETGIVKNPS